MRALVPSCPNIFYVLWCPEIKIACPELEMTCPRALCPKNFYVPSCPKIKIACPQKVFTCPRALKFFACPNILYVLSCPSIILRALVTRRSGGRNFMKPKKLLFDTKKSLCKGTRYQSRESRNETKWKNALVFNFFTSMGYWLKRSSGRLCISQ